MDFTAPISTIMTRKLVTVSAEDRMTDVKEIFDHQKIHHILVVKHTKLVGMISKTDLMHLVKCSNMTNGDALLEKSRLHSYKAEDIMTKGIATVESSTRINVALQIFSENLFHAIPIVDDGEVVGIVTTYDIIKELQKEDSARILAN